MNRSTQTHRHDRASVMFNVVVRYAIGAALLALVAVSFPPTPAYIFAFSALGLYAVISALVRSEPASWQPQQLQGAVRGTPRRGWAGLRRLRYAESAGARHK